MLLEDLQRLREVHPDGAEWNAFRVGTCMAGYGSAVSRMFDFGKAETIGQRSNQEDYCEFVVPERPEADDTSENSGEGPAVVAALADGMGGHVGGQIASRTAVSAFKSCFKRLGALPSPERLYQALISANQALADKRQTNPGLHGMGCTFIGAAFENASLHWVSVGDSLIYRYSNGQLTRLNADHSMAPELDRMAARNELTPEQAQNHPMRQALRSAVTGDELKLIDHSPDPYPFERGDWILLASDGIETLSVASLKIALETASHQPAQALAEHIIAMVEAAENPRQDNATVLTVRWAA